MKEVKKLLVLIFCLSALFLTACGKDGRGTYYPDLEEMENNLKEEGYTVTINDDIHAEYTGTELFAQKGDEFIVFYWLDETEAVKKITNLIENGGYKYNKFVTLEDDSEFGNIVFCGTNKAVEDAGIVIVDVTVKVN